MFEKSSKGRDDLPARVSGCATLLSSLTAQKLIPRRFDILSQLRAPPHPAVSMCFCLQLASALRNARSHALEDEKAYTILQPHERRASIQAKRLCSHRMWRKAELKQEVESPRVSFCGCERGYKRVRDVRSYTLLQPIV